ncbi:hypothetical protein RIF29_24198 [Crotalaria pallida]|uniref:TIR domain-containing protein n=1 Tax=Crotalaria pallida TaxID=3830 RepID=A0AAN9EJB5_CROPI
MNQRMEEAGPDGGKILMHVEELLKSNTALFLGKRVPIYREHNKVFPFVAGYPYSSPYSLEEELLQEHFNDLIKFVKAKAFQTSSSSSSSFSYDVFLSFRGSDTRRGFTGHLYRALEAKGIHTFIDDEEIQSGDEITPSLMKAIQDSRFAIVVLSQNYASSSFCLDELVHIIHTIKGNNRLVLPLFYEVDPSHVRYHHTGTYGEAIAMHEKRFNANHNQDQRLHNWKMALNQVANLSGRHFKQQGYPTSPHLSLLFFYY